MFLEYKKMQTDGEMGEEIVLKKLNWNRQLYLSLKIGELIQHVLCLQKQNFVECITTSTS